MTPIGKGSRFLVLTGPLIGQEGTVRDLSAAGWPLSFDEGKTHYYSTAALEGPGFKRLADAPAEIDPLFAEIATLEAERSQFRGGPAHDDRRPTWDWSDLIHEEANVDCETDEERRERWMEIVVLTLAGIRAIDRR